MTEGVRAYLDHNATTPLRPEARTAMLAAFDVAGNPSSIHAEGRAARAILDNSRRAVADFVGCDTLDVVFTSGATEALNAVLDPGVTCGGRGCDVLLIGAGEHPAVLAGHRFGERTQIVPLTPGGVLDLDALREIIDGLRGDRPMLALQLANNETGVIQPVRAAADMVHAVGGFVVCDIVQGIGKIVCDIKSLGADAVTLSAHKFGGPKGVGALCFCPSAHHIKYRTIRGGGQERGLRGGTENVIGIAGMDAACRAAADRRAGEAVRLVAMRQIVEARVAEIAPDVRVHGAGEARLPNTSCFTVPGYDAQIMLMNLDLDGVAVSAGSACASGKAKASHVLAAMGVAPSLAASTLRVSLGWTTREEDIELFADAFAKARRTMRPRVAA